MTTIIAFILILGLVILVHELGHFISARKLKVTVEEFAIGFPPRIFGWRVWQEKKLKVLAKTEEVSVKVDDYKISDQTEVIKETIVDTVKEIDKMDIVTRRQWFWGNKYKKELAGDNPSIIYSINLLPIGGFVKIKGESGEDEPDDPNSLNNQPKWKKLIIISSGVAMNFVLAFVLLSAAFYFGLPQAVDKDIVGNKVVDRQVVIAEVARSSPAEEQGLKVGDEIILVNGQSFDNSQAVYESIAKNSKEEITLTVNRSGESKEIKVKPRIMTEGQDPIVGIGMIDTGIIKYGLIGSLWQGLKATGIMIVRIVQALYYLLADLIVHGRVGEEFGGPIAVAVVTGEIVKLGWIYILQFAAVLSINLGVLNFFPFPALDGGYALFTLIEMISRRKLNRKVETWIHNSGFIILIALFVLITFRDLGRYGGQIMTAVRNWF